jgi:DNA-binding GntR family transcriptional regulator
MSKDIWETIRIDRRSATPIHEQLRNELQTWIASRQLTYETYMESVPVIASRLSVSIKDVQTALDALVKLRYVVKQEDGRYRVTFLDLHSDLYKPFYIIIDQIAAMGMNVTIEPIERRVGYPTEAESQRFGFPSTTRVLYLKRMYCGDHRAFFLGEHMIPLDFFPMLEELVQGNERIYPLMRELGHVEMTSASRFAEARTMSASLAKLFAFKAGSAFLEVSSQMFDQYRRHIESSVVCLIANYSIELSVSRSSLFEP